MGLFNVDVKRFVYNELPESRQLPKWKDFTYSVVKPFGDWFDQFLGIRLQHLRRRHCDGSVIALISLVYFETGTVIEIRDGQASDIETAKISTMAETASCFIGTMREKPQMYLGKMSESISDIDYIVEIKSRINESIREITIERIKTLVTMYNSAGFYFSVWYNPA